MLSGHFAPNEKPEKKIYICMNGHFALTRHVAHRGKIIKR